MLSRALVPAEELRAAQALGAESFAQRVVVDDAPQRLSPRESVVRRCVERRIAGDLGQRARARRDDGVPQAIASSIGMPNVS